MGRGLQRHSYNVKGTLVELCMSSEAESPKAKCTFRQAEESLFPQQAWESSEVLTTEATSDVQVAPAFPFEQWSEACCDFSGGCAGGVSVPEGGISTPSPMMHPALLPPGVGYLPPLELGPATMACGLAGVPGYNEHGVPGVYIPMLPYHGSYYFPEGYCCGDQEGVTDFDSSSTTGVFSMDYTEQQVQQFEDIKQKDSLAAASVQTELLLEALSEKIQEDKDEIFKELEQNIRESPAPEVSKPVPRLPQEQALPPQEAAGASHGAEEPSPAAHQAAQPRKEAPQPPYKVVQRPETPERRASAAQARNSKEPRPGKQEYAHSRGGIGEGRGRLLHKRRDGEASRLDEQSWGSNNAAHSEDQLITFTTVMLRNIPIKFTRDMLVAQLNLHLRGKFDFIYLPVDFKNGCNVGYGFINFCSFDACRAFIRKFSGVDVCRCLPGINNSNKVAEVVPARVQGFEDNVKRLRSSPVMQELIHHPEWMPLVFDEQGVESLLPLPEGPLPSIKPRPRAKGTR